MTLPRRSRVSARQAPVKATYKGKVVGEYYAGVVVENQVVVELKVIAKILPVQRQQVLTYLRTAKLRLGLIMTFNASVLWREISGSYSEQIS